MSEWHLYERWLSRPKQPASQHLILFRSWAQRKDWKRPRLILVSAQHIFFFFFFFSGVFSGPDGMSWPGGDFDDACRGFTRLSLQLFARLFARRWCIPAEIESWRYLFSCTHVYLCISSNLDQHSRIYRNSLGGGGGHSITMSACAAPLKQPEVECWFQDDGTGDFHSLPEGLSKSTSLTTGLPLLPQHRRTQRKNGPRMHPERGAISSYISLLTTARIDVFFCS